MERIKFIVVVLLLAGCNSVLSAQNILRQNSFSFDLKGMTTLPIVDYEVMKPGYMGEFGVTYYLPVISEDFEYGLKGVFRYGRITGRSEYYWPQSFQSFLYEFYGGFSWGSYSQKGSATVGMNLLAGIVNFDPKMLDGEFMPNNRLGVYIRSAPAFQGDIYMNIPFSPRVSLLIDAGAVYVPFNDYLDDIKSGKSDLYLTGGIGLRLNLFRNLDADGDGVSDLLDLCPNSMYGAAVDKFGCDKSQSDSDKDGVSDSEDRCPGTPANEKVDAFGCAPSQKDTDADGIKDNVDLCPDTFRNTQVDKNGCADYQKDDDKDGIANDRDRCPGTQAGQKVDADGCSAQQLDTDGDGVPNVVDSCPGEPEDYNFYKDEDGCPDKLETVYSSEPVDFSFQIAPFLQDGGLNPHIAGALRLYIIEEYLNKFPATSWIIRVNSPQLALTKADNLKAFIDKEIGASDRTRIEYSQSGTTDVIKLILDVQKAKERYSNTNKK